MTRRSRRRGGRGSGRRRLVALFVFALLLALAATGGLWSWSHRAGRVGEPVAFGVSAGATPSELSAQLEQAGFVDDAWLFRLYLTLTNRAAKVRPGEHLLRRGLSPAALAARLSRSGARPIVKFTIVEGYHRFMVARRLEALDISFEAAFLAASVDAEKLELLGISAPSAEGYLFPATYELYVDSDPAVVLRTFALETKRRHEAIAKRYTDELARHLRERGWGMHELLTLASVVEKEAADGREHGLIASVFYNRLKDPSFLPRRMLQSDPTAGYGCLLAGDTLESCRGYNGKVTPAMLRDASNPYNTYRHPGLPPGPIGSPSQSAIEAVIDPPQSPYFFFVAVQSKRHVFSRTLSEHERAIASGARPPEAAADSADADVDIGGPSNLSQKRR